MIKSVLILVLLFFSLIIALRFVNSFVPHYGCLEYKTIKTIGGCDRDGHCGYSFEDGSTGSIYEIHHPVVGQRVCARRGKIGLND